MKRFVAGLLAVLLFFQSPGSILAGELGEKAFTPPEQLLTGLLEPELIELNASEVQEEPYECDPNILEIMPFSEIYNYDWDKYSTNYYYNQLEEDARALWDSWDVMCAEYLYTEKDAIPYGQIYRTELVKSNAFTKADMLNLARMFRFSNPQYYFLNTSLLSSTYSDGTVAMGFGIYTIFGLGADRKVETNKVKNQVNVWENIIASCGTDAEKVRVIHDLVCNKVDYNDAIYDADFDENKHYSQSAYSVLCTDLTVCAGYSQAFEMMCNGVGIDTVAVTSYNHEWNKVRINDSWYNVDCTWSDGNVIDYTWFERSDAIYDREIKAESHEEESYWLPYLPPCTLDTNPSSYWEPGTLPTITARTATPVVEILAQDSGNLVTISCTTEGADIYYTLNGETPSPAYTRSIKYTRPFMADVSEKIKVIALCDGYWDSDVAIIEGYLISYELDGGINHEDNPTCYITGPNDIVLGNPQKVGYTFEGWYTDSQFQNKVTSIAAGATGNITLYAKWIANTFTITFDSNHENATGTMDVQNVVYGSNATLAPNEYQMPGYVFIGWNTRGDGSGTLYEDGAVCSELTIENGANITLYALWDKAEYTISYILNGGTNHANNPTSYTSASAVAIKNPTKTGYTFGGWYADAKLTKKVTSISAGSTGDRILYAKWNVNKYTIVYNKNGATSGTVKNTECTYGKSVKLRANTYKRTGYKFAGWNTKKSGKGVSYTNKEAIKSLSAKNGAKITLYAQWKPLNYKITYKLNGGKNNTKNPGSYDTGKVIKLKNPTRKGYKFAGWYTDKKFKNKVTKITKDTTGKITLYAKWK